MYCKVSTNHVNINAIGHTPLFFLWWNVNFGGHRLNCMRYGNKITLRFHDLSYPVIISTSNCKVRYVLIRFTYSSTHLQLWYKHCNCLSIIHSNVRSLPAHQIEFESLLLMLQFFCYWIDRNMVNNIMFLCITLKVIGIYITSEVVVQAGVSHYSSNLIFPFLKGMIWTYWMKYLRHYLFK